MPTSTIDELRARIDEEDRALLVAVSRRLELVRQVGQAKRAAGLPVVDPVREGSVVRVWRAHALALGVPEPLADSLRATLVAASRRLQDEEALG